MHPTFKSPWVATALVGIVGAILCLTVDLDTLITLTGAVLVVDYAMISIAALVGGAHGRDRWQPVPHAVVAGAAAARPCGARLYHHAANATALIVTGATIAIGLVYWGIYILPQGGRAWTLRHPALDHGELPGPEKAQAEA